jgi:DNA-binding NarL/FixJ family response regulator
MSNPCGSPNRNHWCTVCATEHKRRLGQPGTRSHKPTRVANTEPTSRELDVLKLLAEGLSNKLIADRLNISLNTAKFHVSNALRKLGLDTRAGAAAEAVRLGLA